MFWEKAEKRFAEKVLLSLIFAENSVLLRIRHCWEFGFAERSVLLRKSVLLRIKFCWEFTFAENSLLLRSQFSWGFNIAENQVLLRIRLSLISNLLFYVTPKEIGSKNSKKKKKKKKTSRRLMFFITDLFWSNVQQLKLLIRQNCLKKCYYFILFFTF